MGSTRCWTRGHGPSRIPSEGSWGGAEEPTFLLWKFPALDLGSHRGLGAEVGAHSPYPWLSSGYLPRSPAELQVLPELLGLRLGISARARICQGADTRYLASTTVQPLERWRSRPGAATG